MCAACSSRGCFAPVQPDCRSTLLFVTSHTGPAPASRVRRAVGRVALTPTRLVALGFAAAIAVGTGLLWLPAATQPGASTGVVDALFTATSAMCLTGLVVVDTPTHWSGFGQGVILALIQVGGFGIMTMASLVGLMLANRIGFGSMLLRKFGRRGSATSAASWWVLSGSAS